VCHLWQVDEDVTIITGIYFVCIFVLLHKAIPFDKPQLGYMVNKLYKTLKLYQTLNEGIRKWEG